MEPSYHIVYEENPEDLAWRIIGHGVSCYNKDQVGESYFQRLCFILQGPEREIVGGILGETNWNWFYLDLLWVKKELRGQGYGSQLMDKDEEEARKRGVQNAYLDTFSFQAPGFYEKYGYQEFVELPDFPSGSTRYFYKKEL